MIKQGEQLSKGPPFVLSVRFVLSLLTSLCFLNIYQQRINLSVAIVCMVNYTATDNYEGTERHSRDIDASCHPQTTTVIKENGNLIWSKTEQGAVLGSFFWGFFTTQLLGGWLAERYGTKQVLFGFVLLGTLATLATPLAAGISPLVVVLIRIVSGMGQGAGYSSVQSLWGRWAPPTERSILTGITYMGCDLGVILFYPIDAFLCDAFGWPSVFYVSGSIGIIWCVLWQLTASDSPAESKLIGRTELRYIEQSLAGQIRTNQLEHRHQTPWRQMLLSGPVWALLWVHFAECAGYYLILTMLPSYMHEVLRFDIKQNGLLSALPYIGNFIVVYVTVYLSDLVIERRFSTTTVARKFCCVVGLTGTATTLVAAGYCDCHTKYLAVGFIIAAQAFGGMRCGGYMVNSIDIAPSFAGTITGICCTAGALAGLILPNVAAAMTPNHSAAEWRSVFWLTFGIHVSGAVVFLLFGDGKVQKWAKDEQEFEDTRRRRICEKTNSDTTPLL